MARVERNGVTFHLPNGWSEVVRPAGLRGVPSPPRLTGLSPIVDVDFVRSLPADPHIPVEPEPGQDIAVLVERDGVWSWHLPDHSRGGTVEVNTGPHRPTEDAPQGLVGEMLLDKLRAIVYRVAVDAVVRAGVQVGLAVLEARRRQGPVHVVGPDPGEWLRLDHLHHIPQPTGDRRVLILLHGAFSSTMGSFAQLQPVLGPLIGSYGLIVGFDHHTLSRSPSENAVRIQDALGQLPWQPERVDLVAYSRGGLVLRALLSMLAPAWRQAVEHCVFLGSPNGGTPLADREQWTELLDRFTNLSTGALKLASVVPGAAAVAVTANEVLEGLSTLLVSLATHALSPEDVPGLAAMDPAGSWLAQLQEPDWATLDCIGIAADHEPSGALANLADGVPDILHGGPNDRVVPVASVMPPGAAGDVEVLEDREVTHTTMVGAAASRVQEVLGIATPAGLADPHVSSPGARASALQVVRAHFVRFPAGLPDDVAEEVFALEEAHPGLLDEADASQAAPAAAPPDRFDEGIETRQLRRTVVRRFGYRDEPALPQGVRGLLNALRLSGSSRVVGSARSHSNVSDPRGSRLIGTPGLGERWLEPPPMLEAVAHGVYWCGAGRTFRGIVGDLVDEGRAIANMGSGAFQTIAGAISTGTHGSGLGLGAVHTQVAALVVLTSVDGQPEVQVLEREDMPVCDPDRFDAWAEAWRVEQGLAQRPKHVPSTDRMRAFVVSLGCLGIIIGVGLRVVPGYFLREQRLATTWSIERADVLTRARNHRHYEMLINPWPDGQGTHRCLSVRRDPSDATEPDGKRPLLMRMASEGISRPVIDFMMEQAIKAPLERLRKRADRSIDSTTVTHYVDRWDQVLRLNLTAAAVTGEYAVPFEEVVAAVDTLLDLCRKQIEAAAAFQQQNPGELEALWRQHPVPAGPIAVRFVQKDDAMLSPAQGRDTATLEFHQVGSGQMDERILRPRSQDRARDSRYRAYHKGRRKLLATAEELLAEKHDARAHWGLFHTLDGTTARARFPGFADWLAVYEDANISGEFDGKITDQLGISNG